MTCPFSRLFYGHTSVCYTQMYNAQHRQNSHVFGAATLNLQLFSCTFEKYPLASQTSHRLQYLTDFIWHCWMASVVKMITDESRKRDVPPPGQDEEKEEKTKRKSPLGNEVRSVVWPRQYSSSSSSSTSASFSSLDAWDDPHWYRWR